MKLQKVKIIVKQVTEINGAHEKAVHFSLQLGSIRDVKVRQKIKLMRERKSLAVSLTRVLSLEIFS